MGARNVTHHVLAALVLAASAAAWRNDLPAAYVLYNARVYTANEAAHDDPVQRVEAFAVRDGRFAATGTSREVLAAFPTLPAVDMNGTVVLPGLIDAHVHLMEQGYLLTQVDLAGSQSVDEVIARIEAYVEANPVAPGQWIFGRGWDQTLWPSKEFPTKEDLDGAFPTTPVWLQRIDGHAGWANSATLLAVPPLPDTDPEGGSIIRDDATDEPTGVFIDNAMWLVEDYAPEKTEEEQLTALSLAIRECNRLGLTGVHDAGVQKETIDLFRRAIDSPTFNFTLRNYVFLRCANGVYFCPEDSPIVIGYGRDQLTVRAVKFQLDGALGSWGAAMLEPYSDDPSTSGLLLLPPAELEAATAKWVAAGYQVNTHAIGDRANQLTIDIFERVWRAAGLEQDLRLRIEHAQILTPEDVPRLASLGILPSVQPTHCTSDKGFVVDRIGEERMAGAYVWRTFFEAGLRVPMGSDFPVERVNPFLGIHAAVTRQDANNQPPGGFYPSEAVTVAQAIRGFTLDAAYAAFQERELGSIAAGKLADFVLIDRDPYAVPPSELRTTAVLATVFSGETVFCDGAGCELLRA